MVAAMIANANRDPKRRSQPFEPGDFFTPLAPEPLPIGIKLRRVFGSAQGEIEAALLERR